MDWNEPWLYVYVKSIPILFGMLCFYYKLNCISTSNLIELVRLSTREASTSIMCCSACFFFFDFSEIHFYKTKRWPDRSMFLENICNSSGVEYEWVAWFLAAPTQVRAEIARHSTSTITTTNSVPYQNDSCIVELQIKQDYKKCQATQRKKMTCVYGGNV